MINWILKSIISVLVVALSVLHCEAVPNILYIFSDDHSHNAISAYGSLINLTPNIDRIANEGAIFLNTFCANSICQPSRATILTGKHSHKNGVENNGSSWDSSQVIFPRLLKSNAGYQTALIGKWHMEPHPTDEFDFWKVLENEGGQGRYFNPEFDTQSGSETLPGYSTDVITDEAINWLENRDTNAPFMLMCQFKSPHVPQLPPVRNAELFTNAIPEPVTLYDDYQNRQPYISQHWMGLDIAVLGAIPPLGSSYEPHPSHTKNINSMTPEQQTNWHNAYDEWSQEYYDFMATTNADDPTLLKEFQYQRVAKNYLRCVAAVDENVGRLLQWLEDQNLENDTIVIYSSDQGYYIGEHGMTDKRWMYEESMRMPLLIRWPGKINPGTAITQFVQNIDYAPTILEMAGVPVPEVMQGVSLLPILNGNTTNDWRDSLYYHYYDHGKHNVPRHEGVRTERYKLIRYYTDGNWELFDMQEDPHELVSVYEYPEYQEIVGMLKIELERLRVQYEVPPNAFGKEIFDPNLLLNSGFEARNGTTLADAINWNQTENAYRQEWGQRMGDAGMMFQNWNGFTGDVYQVVSTNVPNGETLMLKFFAKINDDTRFDSAAEVYARIELKSGATVIQTHDIQILPELTNSINEWLSFNSKIVNTNDNIDAIAAKFVVSGLTGGIVTIDDTLLGFPTSFEEQGFEQNGVWWDIVGNCALETWAAKEGELGTAFYGWMGGGSADISQQFITNCTPNNGNFPFISFSIYAKANENYYSTSGDTKLSLSFVGSPEILENNIHNDVTNSQNIWNKYNVTYNNLSGTISEVKVGFSAADFAATGGSQALMFDDAELSITWIPEPSRLLFIGLLGTAVFFPLKLS